MTWIYFVSYFIVGFVFLLIGQILNQKGLDGFGFFEADGDMVILRAVVTLTVLFWPVLLIFYMIGLFIPWFVISAYKLFVGVIFGTMALVKKQEDK